MIKTSAHFAGSMDLAAGKSPKSLPIDTIAFQTAASAGIRNQQFLPDRKKFPGKLVLKAFQERNKQIVDSCDILLAIWDGKSRGTENTLAYARKINKPAFLIKIQISERIE